MDYSSLAKDLFAEEEKKNLQEKLILYNDGARYGQAVFLAGGTASGKSFAIKNFLEGQKFKVLDVDKWKEVYSNLKKKMEKFPKLMKKSDLADKYPEIRDLDLGNPEDVNKLHQFIKDKGIHKKYISNLVGGKDSERLPNILFDVTLKDISKVHNYLPQLKESGYKPENIHITWVLTDYEIAVERNRERDRIVPDDIVLKSHEGSAETMIDIIKKGTPRGVDGSVRIILNNPETTVFWKREGDPVQTSEGEDYFVIDDFKYLTLKETGKSFKDTRSIKKQLFKWIRSNVPKTAKTWKKMKKSRKK